MTDLVQRLRGPLYGWNVSELCAEAADHIEALECDVNAIHHAMKEAGWHPGRTDDKLTDIIKAKGAEMARLNRENAELRNAALEEAAVVCDELFSTTADTQPDRCAKEIRSLKT
jgi:hypothetical protein